MEDGRSVPQENMLETCDVALETEVRVRNSPTGRAWEAACAQEVLSARRPDHGNPSLALQVTHAAGPQSIK